MTFILIASLTNQNCCLDQELADDRHELKAAQRQLRHEHAQLVKDKAATQDKLAELQQKAVDVQMLKFGQVRASKTWQKLAFALCIWWLLTTRCIRGT